jgi:chaperonin cofactor prefoldin
VIFLWIPLPERSGSMDNKDLLIEMMTKQISDLTALVQTLTESNAALNETIKELQETIREL